MILDLIPPGFQERKFTSQDLGGGPPSVLADLAVEKGFALGRIGVKE